MPQFYPAGTIGAYSYLSLKWRLQKQPPKKRRPQKWRQKWTQTRLIQHMHKAWLQLSAASSSAYWPSWNTGRYLLYWSTVRYYLYWNTGRYLLYRNTVRYYLYWNTGRYLLYWNTVRYHPETQYVTIFTEIQNFTIFTETQYVTTFTETQYLTILTETQYVTFFTETQLCYLLYWNIVR